MEKRGQKMISSGNTSGKSSAASVEPRLVKVAIRYSRHTEHNIVDQVAMLLSAGNKAAEVAHDLNVFFAAEGLGYYATAEGGLR